MWERNGRKTDTFRRSCVIFKAQDEISEKSLTLTSRAILSQVFLAGFCGKSMFFSFVEICQHGLSHVQRGK